jgi:hypothetical protein
LTVTGPGVRIPLSPQKETHNIVVGFFFSKKKPNLFVLFLEKKRQNSCKEFGFLCLLRIPFWDARSESLFLRKTLVNNLIFKVLFFESTEELTVVPFRIFFISILLHQITEGF